MSAPQVAKIIRMNNTSTTPHPMWIGAQQINDPKQTIETFFYLFQLNDCHHYLWEMLQSSVASEAGFLKDFPPSTMLFFYQHLSLLIEAAHIIHTPPPTEAA
jgi:hypothetical protein